MFWLKQDIEIFTEEQNTLDQFKENLPEEFEFLVCKEHRQLEKEEEILFDPEALELACQHCILEKLGGDETATKEKYQPWCHTVNMRRKKCMNSFEELGKIENFLKTVVKPSLSSQLGM